LRVTLKMHKDLQVIINEDAIDKRVKEIATQLEKELAEKDPLFIVVMNGAFMFAADLLRNFTAPSTMAFIQIKSYNGTSRYVLDANEKQLPELHNKHVVVIEDIVDSGTTLKWLVHQIESRGPASLRSVALINKKVPHEAEADIYGFDVDDIFIVGYGLDVDGRYRNLKGIFEIRSNS